MTKHETNISTPDSTFTSVPSPSSIIVPHVIVKKSEDLSGIGIESDAASASDGGEESESESESKMNENMEVNKMKSTKSEVKIEVTHVATSSSSSSSSVSNCFTGLSPSHNPVDSKYNNNIVSSISTTMNEVSSSTNPTNMSPPPKGQEEVGLESQSGLQSSSS